MAHASRPLIGLLLATVLFFAVWVVALKPSGSGTGANSSSKPALGQYQADINAAHHAVTTAATASARAGGAAPASPATSPAPTTKAPVRHAPVRTAARPSPSVKTPVKHASGARPAVGRMSAVQHALHSHKVLALLFYNPAAPDDRAVRQELAGVPTHGGKVFKLSIPLGEIDSYMAITNQVTVNFSPTLVLIAPNGQADEIVGYADPFEISQRVGDALAIRR